MSAWWIVVQWLALSGFSLLAYVLRVLDFRGAVASFILGLIIIFSGGLDMLLLMAAFTGVAFLATRMGRSRKHALGLMEDGDGERSLSNVIGNGAAPALAALTVFLDAQAAALAYATAVAAILADTMGSEIGVLSSKARRITPPFPATGPGANGSVSWLGQFSAAAGSTFIAVVAWVLLDLPSEWVWLPALAGFLGSQLDSVLGATLERDYLRNDRPLGKQDVNFLASFLPALGVFFAFYLT